MSFNQKLFTEIFRTIQSDYDIDFTKKFFLTKSEEVFNDFFKIKVKSSKEKKSETKEKKKVVPVKVQSEVDTRLDIFEKICLEALKTNTKSFLEYTHIQNTIDEFKFDDEKFDLENNVKFFSNAAQPFNLLSNFSLIDEGIIIDGLEFPSSEHAFQANRFDKPKDRQRFTTDGDLGQVDSGFQLIYGDEWEKKRDWWMKKGNIGIIAKLAVSEKYRKDLGLTINSKFQSTDELWIKILSAKFSIEKLKSVLLSTSGKYLLEFDRGAKKSQEDYKNPPYWCGLIEDGKLFGHNIMGHYLMIIRAYIKDGKI